MKLISGFPLVSVTPQVPEVEAVPAYGQVSIGCVERFGLLVMNEAGPAPPHFHPVELLGSRLMPGCDRLTIASTKDIAALVYLKEGRRAPIAATVYVLGRLSDAPVLLFALALVFRDGAARIL
jgi:hypothetical protein